MGFKLTHLRIEKKIDHKSEDKEFMYPLFRRPGMS